MRRASSPCFPIHAAESAAGGRLLRRVTTRLESVLDRRTESAARRIVERVRRGGDRALVELVRELDGAPIGAAAELRLQPSAEDRAGRALPEATRDAIETAIAAVEGFHRATPGSAFSFASRGLRIVETSVALARVGVYVPGGLASYPSTAIMTVVPARVAGVAEIVVATPPGGWTRQPVLRYTLARLGVTEILGAGGAQAIAALAYGTESLRPVDAIVGPGNAWVTAAKKLVAGRVRIDGLMGPSEVVVLATAGADAERIAADLLAQAEHDPQASALLITPERALAKRVAAAVERRLPRLATEATARAALARYGGALIVATIEQAIERAERVAPEHLQLSGAEAEAAAPRFRNAGAIFVGERTPEVLGDYVAGPSHVLPTCGTARFASGLSVDTFLRRCHRIETVDPDAAAELAEAAAILADVEGLPAHAVAARLRTAKAAGEPGR